MSETKTNIYVPGLYRVAVEDLRLLGRDSQNPKKMSEKQKASLWKDFDLVKWQEPDIFLALLIGLFGRA